MVCSTPWSQPKGPLGATLPTLLPLVFKNKFAMSAQSIYSQKVELESHAAVLASQVAASAAAVSNANAHAMTAEAMAANAVSAGASMESRALAAERQCTLLEQRASAAEKNYSVQFAFRTAPAPRLGTLGDSNTGPTAKPEKNS